MTTVADRANSFLLTIAALTIAGILVHREVFSRATVGAPALKQEVKRVDDWQTLVGSGLRIGPSSARMTVVEFGDFECPFCRQFAQAFHDVRARYGADVALVFVDYPLTRIHRFALPSARAAACANDQGRFAAFHDAVYEKQDSLGLKSWVSYAVDAGVTDTMAFERCNASNAPVLAVETGQALGKRLQIRGTPTVFINGWRLSRPPDDSLLAALAAGIFAGRDVPAAIAAASSP